MIPRETLELLFDTARGAAAPQRVEINDPRKIIMIRGDEVTRIDVPPPLRQSFVNSLETLIECAQRESIVAKPVIWHDDPGVEFAVDDEKSVGQQGNVMLILDDEDRRDWVCFSMPWSRQFRELALLEHMARIEDQRSFIRLLRVTLGVDEPRVAPFRRLTWTSGAKAEGDLQHGRDRLGHEIQAQAVGAVDLPEDLLLNVPVYDALGERATYQVRCHVEIDLAAQRLGLVPFAGEIRLAIDQAQLSIHDRLTQALGDQVPVYYGKP